MGEHKRNPVAQLAKDGRLNPKKKKHYMSKREMKRAIFATTRSSFYSKLGIFPEY